MNATGRMVCYSISVDGCDTIYRVECAGNLLNDKPIAKAKVVDVTLETGKYFLSVPAPIEQFSCEPDVFSPCPEYIETPGKWYTAFNFENASVLEKIELGNDHRMENLDTESESSDTDVSDTEGSSGDEDLDGENSSSSGGSGDKEFSRNEKMDVIDESCNMDIEYKDDFESLRINPYSLNLKNKKVDLIKNKGKEKTNFKKSKKNNFVENKENRLPKERRGFSIKCRRPVLLSTSYEEINRFYDVSKLPIINEDMCQALRFWIAYKYITENREKFTIMDIALHFDLYYSTLLKYKDKIIKPETYEFLSPGEYSKKSVNHTVLSYGREEDIEEFVKRQTEK